MQGRSKLKLGLLDFKGGSSDLGRIFMIFLAFKTGTDSF